MTVDTSERRRWIEANEVDSIAEFDVAERHAFTACDGVMEHWFPNGMTDTGRALLCVPGYAATGKSFARLRPLASDFDVRLLTITSDAMRNVVNAYAAVLAKYAKGFQRPVLLGTSFGGLIVLRAAAHLRERISGLVLISTYAAVTSPVRRLLVQTGIATAVERIAAAVPPVAYALLGSRRLDDAAAAELKRESAKLDPRQKHERLVAAMHADLRRMAARLRVPTLIIHGGADPLVPVSAAKELASLITDSSIVVIGRAGHLPYLTHPGEVNSVLKSFVRARLTARRAAA